MSIAEARALAWELLTVGAAHREYRLAIDDSQTREEIFGWVFFYNSAEFMATRDLRWALGGNAPLIVDRVSRAVVVTGTARPVDVYLAHYSQHGTLDGFR